MLPGEAGSPTVTAVAEPPEADGPVLVETIVIGIYGTDREICDGHYGLAPPSAEGIVIGHESLGRVLDAPAASGLAVGT